MNKNEMITIELTRDEFDFILMALREVFFEIDQITNHNFDFNPNIDHTLLCYKNLPKITDIYNVIATILGYETRIILIDKENNK